MDVLSLQPNDRAAADSQIAAVCRRNIVDWKDNMTCWKRCERVALGLLAAVTGAPSKRIASNGLEVRRIEAACRRPRSGDLDGHLMECVPALVTLGEPADGPSEEI